MNAIADPVTSAAVGAALAEAVTAAMHNQGPDVRASQDDIPASHWQGGDIDCAACPYTRLLQRPARLGCAPGHACMQDVYARRVDRFFRWHPELSDEQLAHPYFEVRAIAARYGSVFRLTALMVDPDETVRLQVALRLPMSQLLKMVGDPHREVRIRVAQRLAPIDLALMRRDPDYGVRELVALRLPLPLLPTMSTDADRAVRMRVAKRLEMPALLRMADDREPEVRRIVAERLPTGLLMRLGKDSDWRVRFEVAQRADAATLHSMQHDAEPDIRQTVQERLAQLQTTDNAKGAIHG